MVERPATCASCGKRMSRKQWYYRNGQFFCKKRCWKTASQKKEKESLPAPPAGGAQAGEPAAAG